MDLLTLVITSGVVAAVVGGLVSHYSARNLEARSRTMETRKELYTRTCNQLAFFICTVSDEKRNSARGELLRCFREVQIWGSDEVARNFKKLVDLMLPEKINFEDERNLQYKKLIVAMRKDILGKSGLTPEEMDIRGFRE